MTEFMWPVDIWEKVITHKSKTKYSFESDNAYGYGSPEDERINDS